MNSRHGCSDARLNIASSDAVDICDGLFAAASAAAAAAAAEHRSKTSQIVTSVSLCLSGWLVGTSLDSPLRFTDAQCDSSSALPFGFFC